MSSCKLLNTARDRLMPSEFTSSYHVHILVREGEMRFSDGKQTHVSQKDDLVIGRVMQIFLYDLWTVYSAEMSQMETNDNAARIFLRFLSLVQQDCRQQRDVAYYADKLCITSKYLSQVSRSVSGLPASEWITYYATFELVSLLNDQSKTLTEVADLMNFETASHFSRYVKKLLGKSPSEYRQK